MRSYLAALRRYATFSGRTRRSEFWLFTLFDLVAGVGLLVLAVVAGAVLDGRWSWIPAALEIAFFGYEVLTLVPALAIRVRRLHDTGRSGWFYLVHLIPLVGPLMLLVELCTDGTAGPNRHGPDPKGRGLVGPWPAEPHQPAYGLGWGGRLLVRAGIVVGIIVTCSVGGAVAYHFAPGPDDATGSGPVHAGGTDGASKVTGSVPAGSKASTTPVLEAADLNRVCDGYFYPDAPRYTGLSPHPITIGVRDRTFGDDRLVRSKVYLPYSATGPVAAAWNPKDPSSVQLMACVDQIGTGPALPDCTVAKPSPAVVPMREGRFRVAVYEVATRRKLTEVRVTGDDQECGLLVVVGEDDTAYSSISEDQLVATLARYVEE